MNKDESICFSAFTWRVGLRSSTEQCYYCWAVCALFCESPLMKFIGMFDHVC